MIFIISIAAYISLIVIACHSLQLVPPKHPSDRIHGGVIRIKISVKSGILLVLPGRDPAKGHDLLDPHQPQQPAREMGRLYAPGAHLENRQEQGDDDHADHTTHKEHHERLDD